MSRGGALGGGLLVVLERPRSWVLALAGFLVRGGIVLFALPVVVLPTATGLANAIGPDLASFVFGGPSTGLIAMAVAAAALAVAWIIGGGLAAAATDVALIATTRDDDGGLYGPADARSLAGRMLLARAICHLPLAVVLSLGALRVVAATYAELIRPGDLGVPVVVRVAAAVPEVLLALGLAWLVGEMTGGLAARRLASGGSSVLRAVGWAAGRLVREPTATVLAAVVPFVVSFAVLVPALAGSVVAWARVRELLRGDAEPQQVAAGIVLFVIAWGGALVLAAVGSAWRSAALTLEAARVAAPASRDVRGMAA